MKWKEIEEIALHHVEVSRWLSWNSGKVVFQKITLNWTAVSCLSLLRHVESEISCASTNHFWIWSMNICQLETPSPCCCRVVWDISYCSLLTGMCWKVWFLKQLWADYHSLLALSWSHGAGDCYHPRCCQHKQLTQAEEQIQYFQLWIRKVTTIHCFRNTSDFFCDLADIYLYQQWPVITRTFFLETHVTIIWGFM